MPHHIRSGDLRSWLIMSLLCLLWGVPKPHAAWADHDVEPQAIDHASDLARRAQELRPLVEQYVTDTHSRDPHTRAVAFYQLVQLAPPVGIDITTVLTDAASHEHEPMVLEQVISGLEHVEEGIAVDTLTYLLQTTADSELRQRIVEALFRFRDLPLVQEEFQRLLVHDPDPTVRHTVALWFGLLQTPEVYHALTQAYAQEPDVTVRAVLMRAMALQRVPEAQPAQVASPPTDRSGIVCDDLTDSLLSTDSVQP